jgi:hypothetical protein
MLGIIPIVAVIAWLATKDPKVLIAIPGAIIFVGAPWFVFWIIRSIITGHWKWT